MNTTFDVTTLPWSATSFDVTTLPWGAAVRLLVLRVLLALARGLRV